MFRRLCLPALAIALASPPAAAAEPFRFERPLMGTRFTIACHAPDHASAARAADAAFAIAAGIDRCASDYDPGSELLRISTHPVGTPVPVSPLLFDLLDHSRRLAGSTRGAFDPTLGPLTRLWRETRERRALPAAARLAAARAACGWRQFSLDPAARTVTLHQPGMAFDLGGIAKGHAADLMLESLRKAGLPRAMIAAGGDIRLGDPPPGREGWRVAIQTRDPGHHEGILTLANAAVSTSGDLHQWVEIEGVRHSHILDPASGLGLTRRIAATVVASEAKLSDPLATAACVLGPRAAAPLRQLPGVREVRVRLLQDSPNTPR